MDKADITIGGQPGQAVDIAGTGGDTAIAGRIAVARPDAERLFLAVAFAPDAVWDEAARADFESVGALPTRAHRPGDRMDRNPPRMDNRPVGTPRLGQSRPGSQRRSAKVISHRDLMRGAARFPDRPLPGRFGDPPRKPLM